MWNDLGKSFVSGEFSLSSCDKAHKRVTELRDGLHIFAFKKREKCSKFASLLCYRKAVVKCRYLK